MNPMCACKTEVETTEHFLLHCHFYSTKKLEIFENLEKVDPNVLSFSAKNQIFISLHGSQRNNSKIQNQVILKNVISYPQATTRFDRPLINFNQ